MLRRNLIALFALLSGLAALQAPAHASAAQIVAAQSRSLAGGVEVQEASHAHCAFACTVVDSASGETTASFDLAPLPSLAVPYVVGVERALE